MQHNEIPRTSRPHDFAGPDERPASTNTLEETKMSTEKGSASLGRANHPCGVVDTIRHIVVGGFQEDGEMKAAVWDRATLREVFYGPVSEAHNYAAVAESDEQLTNLGALWSRAHRGAFDTVAEVGDAMRRIVGAE